MTYPTFQPGLHEMPEDCYHADPCATPSYSNSIGKVLIAQSPAHAWHAHPKLNPAHELYEDSRFDLGTAAHDALLLGSSARIAVIDAADWRTKAAKAARDEARANGLLPILAKHDYAVRKMVEKAKACIERSEYAGVLDAGDAERVVIWNENGVLCRSRIDWLTADRTLILDYKTTEDAAPEPWARGHMTKLGYDMQAELYPRGVLATCGVAPRFVFLVQEINRPYECSFVTLSEPARQLAEAKNNFAMDLWAKCLKANRWPGYSRTLLAEPKPYEMEELEMGKWQPEAEPVTKTEEDEQLAMFAGAGRSDRGGKPSFANIVEKP